MRELGSRLAALALALVFGAAGGQPPGSSSPTGSACSVEAAAPASATDSGLAVTGLPRASTGGGWKRAESERTGSTPEGDDTCRAEVQASPRPADAPQPGAKRSGLPNRRSSGLLGLATSPANAPPGS